MKNNYILVPTTVVDIRWWSDFIDLYIVLNLKVIAKYLYYKSRYTLLYPVVWFSIPDFIFWPKYSHGTLCMAFWFDIYSNRYILQMQVSKKHISRKGVLFIIWFSTLCISLWRILFLSTTYSIIKNIQKSSFCVKKVFEFEIWSIMYIYYKMIYQNKYI